MKITYIYDQIKLWGLMAIPYCIFFSTGGIFSVQDLMPVLLLILLADMLKVKSINVMSFSFVVFVLFFIGLSIGLLLNLVSYSTDAFSELSIMRIIYFLFVIYIFFSLSNMELKEQNIKKVMFANFFASVIIATYLIFVNHIWFHSFIGGVIDKNFVGAMLVINEELSFLFFCRYRFLNFNCSRYIFLVVAAFLMIGIFFTASRAAVLMCIIGNILVWMTEKISNIKKFIKYVLVIMIIVVILGSVLYFYVLMNISTNNPVQWYLMRYFVNGFGDDSVTGRWIWWKYAIDLWSCQPFWGYGIGNINVSGNSSAVAHNTYLDFLLDQGVWGLSLYISILIFVIKRILKSSTYTLLSVLFSLALLTGILSATRSVLLWNSLILISILTKLNGLKLKEKL